ncbi:MAG TPA: hypothetical protein EYP90_09640, partial [Chromatiaceae bacterium]|nr:hypothetical protein [Chromatiaceae bacterium]
MDTTGYLTSTDAPALSRLAPDQINAGGRVTLYGTNFGPPVQATVIQYEYDPLCRLTKATCSGDANVSYAYVYDAVGNMTAFTETVGISPPIATRSFNAANQLV